MARSLVWVLLFALPLAGNPSASPQASKAKVETAQVQEAQIQPAPILKIETTKKTYNPYEPIPLRIILENPSSEPLIFLKPISAFRFPKRSLAKAKASQRKPNLTTAIALWFSDLGRKRKVDESDYPIPVFKKKDPTWKVQELGDDVIGIGGKSTRNHGRMADDWKVIPPLGKGTWTIKSANRRFSLPPGQYRLNFAILAGKPSGRGFPIDRFCNRFVDTFLQQSRSFVVTGSQDIFIQPPPQELEEKFEILRRLPMGLTYAEMVNRFGSPVGRWRITEIKTDRGEEIAPVTFFNLPTPLPPPAIQGWAQRFTTVEPIYFYARFSPKPYRLVEVSVYKRYPTPRD